MPKTKDYKVRTASPEDAIDIVYLGKKFVKESQNENLGWNQEKVFDTTLEVLERDDFLVLVIENEDDIVGMFIAFITPCFFSDVKQAVEIAWYVLPEHRQNSKAQTTLSMYEEWAQANDVKQINMINLDVLNRDRVAKFYKKLGYRPTENTFSKELH